VVAAIPAIVAVGSALYGAHEQNKARQGQDKLTKSAACQPEGNPGLWQGLL
jgi:hypothetical protein